VEGSSGVADKVRLRISAGLIEGDMYPVIRRELGRDKTLHRETVVWSNKPINGKKLQMESCQSDQPILAMKLGNASRAKGLAGEPLKWGHFLQTQSWIKEVNKTIFCDSFDGG